MIRKQRGIMLAVMVGTLFTTTTTFALNSSESHEAMKTLADNVCKGGNTCSGSNNDDNNNKNSNKEKKTGKEQKSKHKNTHDEN